MERKEFEIAIMDIMHRLESIHAIKTGDYEISLTKTTYHEDGTLKGCGEFFIDLRDAFKVMQIEICLSERSSIYALSYDNIRWLIPYDVRVLNTICEVLL